MTKTKNTLRSKPTAEERNILKKIESGLREKGYSVLGGEGQLTLTGVPMLWVRVRPGYYLYGRYSVSLEQADNGRYVWYCRHDNNPAFDCADTLREAKTYCEFQPDAEFPNYLNS